MVYVNEYVSMKAEVEGVNSMGMLWDTGFKKPNRANGKEKDSGKRREKGLSITRAWGRIKLN